MPSRFDSSLYQQDIEYCANLSLQWDKLADKTIAISGATGMIGTFLIDVLMKKNEDPKFNCQIIAIGRNKSRARSRFPYFDEAHFHFEQLDVSIPGVRPNRCPSSCQHNPSQSICLRTSVNDYLKCDWFAEPSRVLIGGRKRSS